MLYIKHRLLVDRPLVFMRGLIENHPIAFTGIWTSTITVADLFTDLLLLVVVVTVVVVMVVVVVVEVVKFTL